MGGNHEHVKKDVPNNRENVKNDVPGRPEGTDWRDASTLPTRT